LFSFLLCDAPAERLRHLERRGGVDERERGVTTLRISLLCFASLRFIVGIMIGVFMEEMAGLCRE
jgi:hypothetical protein